MEAFCGSWKLKDSGDLEPIANRLGVSIPLKDIAELLNSVMTISPVGDGYSMKISTGGMTYEMKYKLGEEFDHASLDGRPLKTIITLEGKTLKQVDKGDKLMTMESVVEGNTLTMTARLEELVCVRHYTRC